MRISGPLLGRIKKSPLDFAPLTTPIWSCLHISSQDVSLPASDCPSVTPNDAIPAEPGCTSFTLSTYPPAHVVGKGQRLRLETGKEEKGGDRKRRGTGGVLRAGEKGNEIELQLRRGKGGGWGKGEGESGDSGGGWEVLLLFLPDFSDDMPAVSLGQGPCSRSGGPWPVLESGCWMAQPAAAQRWRDEGSGGGAGGGGRRESGGGSLKGPRRGRGSASDVSHLVSLLSDHLSSPLTLAFKPPVWAPLELSWKHGG